MQLNPTQFFHASDPSRTLTFSNPADRRYYIDFSAVRGGSIIRRLERVITRAEPDKPTCQLFTGHIGCGKSTELRRLQAELENQGFHVVYFESTEDLDMANVDISDILLAIARQISRNLEALDIQIQSSRFRRFLQGAWEVIQDVLHPDITGLSLQAPEVEVPLLGVKPAKDIGFSVKEGEYSLSFGIGELTGRVRNDAGMRSLLRQYLEPRVNQMLEVINGELLEPAHKKLQQMGKQGLVVIVDNLDRVDNRQKEGSKRTLPEYLFVDRGDQLRQLQCHVIYTILLNLAFSNEFELLKNRLGDVKRLPMIPIQRQDGSDFAEGMGLLKQMVLARAFPDVSEEARLQGIDQLFDQPAMLERLCQISGGHSRNLLRILRRCLEEDDPPITQDCLERAIREHRDDLSLAITDDEWALIQQVTQQQKVSGEDGHHTLLRSLFVFEYDDPTEGRWFAVNPALRETKKFRSIQSSKHQTIP